MNNLVTNGKKSFFEISVKDAAIHWLDGQINQYTFDRRTDDLRPKKKREFMVYLAQEYTHLGETGCIDVMNSLNFEYLEERYIEMENKRSTEFVRSCVDFERKKADKVENLSSLYAIDQMKQFIRLAWDKVTTGEVFLYRLLSDIAGPNKYDKELRREIPAGYVSFEMEARWWLATPTEKLDCW